VVSTRVGYAGGSRLNPTYYSLGDHSETIRITYDPAKISYQELLDVYWRNTAVSVPPWSRQYMSIIFYHNGEQKMLAEEGKAGQEKQLGKTVYVEIVPAAEFYPAEDYHQKYYLQQISGLMDELRSIYPDFEDIIDSTAAARLNGYAGGFGTPDALEALDELGLSPEGVAIVRNIAETGLVEACPIR
jgi:peptide-methionine (S)-S-oxide reductase